PGAPDQSDGCQPALRPGPVAPAHPAPCEWSVGGAIMKDSPPSGDVALEALLGQIADEFTERLHRGEQPDIEDYARRYPEIADVLRQVLATLQVLGPADLAAPSASGVETRQPITGCLGDFRLVCE